MTYLCLGPKGAGKSQLLAALENINSNGNVEFSVPTIGTNIYHILLDKLKINEKKYLRKKSIQIIEVGGTMAPIWHQYYTNVNKIIYVVDTSNLCQISAAGVLLYGMLLDPRLQKTNFLLVLTKMDLAYRQMRNEALLILQIAKLKKQIRQKFHVIEASGISRNGLNEIMEWLQK